MWIVDFGTSMAREEAALYEAPFEHVRRTVEPTRVTQSPGSVRRAVVAPRRAALGHARRTGRAGPLPRHARPHQTPTVRLVARRNPPDHQLIAIARDDDYTFGVLQSRVHTTWARRMGTQLREAESRPRYTPTTCFETFPFPQPTDEQRTAIAVAAANLDRLRQGWLNPPNRPYDLTDRELARRTLTNLYNQRPTWLVDAHAHLDAAVLDAYGWPADIAEEDLLVRLLDLNLERADAAPEPD